MHSATLLVNLLRLSLATAFRLIPRSQTRGVTSEGFLEARPASIHKSEISHKNLLVGASIHPQHDVLKYRAADPALLLLKLVNNFSGGNIRAYIGGLDANGGIFFVSTNGKLVYPKSKEPHLPSEITEDITISLGSKGQTLEIQLPPFIRSGRVYFADDDLRFFVINMGGGNSVVQPSVTNLKDPNANVNWGFIELSYMNDSLYANISYVDFVGIVLGMILVEKDGNTQTTAGLVADAVAKICDDLVKQKQIDGRDWPSLCIANAKGKPIRVLSPGNQYDLDPRVFDDYWDNYIADVWKRYASQDLIIDTQASPARVKCRVSADQLKCEGTDRGFTKPTGKDIWGCNSGPFAILEGDSPAHAAIVPRICAAFVRSTLLLDGGDIQPSLGQNSYYSIDPTNHYSRIVHSYEVDGRGYAFPYDDVNPNGHKDASGVVSSNKVQFLTIYVGAPPLDRPEQ